MLGGVPMLLFVFVDDVEEHRREVVVTETRIWSASVRPDESSSSWLIYVGVQIGRRTFEEVDDNIGGRPQIGRRPLELLEDDTSDGRHGRC